MADRRRRLQRRAASCRSARRRRSTSGRAPASSPISSAPPTSCRRISRRGRGGGGAGRACGRKRSAIGAPEPDGRTASRRSRHRSRSPLSTAPSTRVAVDADGLTLQRHRARRAPHIRLGDDASGRPAPAIGLHLMDDARMTAPPPAPTPSRRRRTASAAARCRIIFWRNPRLLLGLLLVPPLLWLGVVYIGSLLGAAGAELLLDRRVLRHGRSASSRSRPMRELFAAGQSRHHPAHRADGGAGDAGRGDHRLPDRLLRGALCAGRWKALFYLGVMMPLWSSYLVKIYAWKLILAKEGILTWLFAKAGLVVAARCLAGAAGRSAATRCRSAFIGTFLVFVYVWLPYMILPMQAALERVPRSLVDASADLGAAPGQTFRNVLLPLALPGIVAGSIFTFSLTLGDYIIPQIIGNSRPVHRPGRLCAAGHRRQHPARRRLHRGADRHHGALSLVRQAHGGLRCALIPVVSGSAGPEDRCRSGAAVPASAAAC